MECKQLYWRCAMVRHSRTVMGACLVGVAAGFFAAPLWSRLTVDQSIVDVRAQAEKAPLVFRGRVLTVEPDPVEKRIGLWVDGKPVNTNFVAKFQVDRIYPGKLEGEAVRSEEHTSELQSLTISYAVSC